MISHQQINRIPLSELNLVGLEDLMWIGASEQKKIGAKVGLEKREKV